MRELSRPLTLATVSLLAGLLPAVRYGPPIPALLFAAAGFLLACMVAHRAVAPRSQPRVANAGLLGAFVACGAVMGSAAHASAVTDCRQLIPDGAAVSISGVLGAGSFPGDSAAQGPLLPLRDSRIAVGGRSVPGCGGEVRVGLPEEVRGPLLAGSEVRLRGRWMRSRGPAAASAWPRDPRRAGFVIADKIEGAAPPDLARHPLLTVRGRTEQRLRALFPGHAAIVDALILGRREYLDPQLRDRYARGGLAHLLAISGTHVGLLAGLILLLGSALRVPLRPLAYGTIVLVLAYLLMIGAPASALRAGLMIALALVGVQLQRPHSALPVIATAALLVLLPRPIAILEPGFQLSFAGVLGVVTVRNVALRQLPGRVRDNTILRWFAEGLAISFGAFFFTSALTAYHFQTLAPIAILSNLPALLLLTPIIGGIVAAIAASFVLPPLAPPIAAATALALDVLDRVVSVAAGVPWGHMTVTRPQGWGWAAAAVALLLALDLFGRLRAPLRWFGGGLAAATLLLLWPSAAALGDRGRLELHFIDVGQGDAIAIRTPADRWLLIDAGVRNERLDAGERRVLPFLRSHGARRLEAVLLTHPDADHIGGAPAVLRGLSVGRLIDPGFPQGKPLYLETLREAEARRIPFSPGRKGETLELDGVSLEVLWPTQEIIDAASEANDIGLVLQLRYNGFSALLTGDAPAQVEHRLVAEHGAALRAQLLKAGHHGSRTSTSSDLLDAVRPELVVISVGRYNRYGHPAPQVLRRLEARGIPVARTDRSGTISIEVDATGEWRLQR